MALREEEPVQSTKKLLSLGLPLFILAVLISTMIHQGAHLGVEKLFVPFARENGSLSIFSEQENLVSRYPLAAAAGPTATFIVALLSFGYFLHNPRNLFAMAMAFVNASSRVTDTIAVFLQLLLHKKTTMIVDESLSLALLPLKDPTISIIMMCFFSLITFFLTLIIVHDTKTIPRKWLVALVLFLLVEPLENVAWKVMEGFLKSAG